MATAEETGPAPEVEIAPPEPGLGEGGYRGPEAAFTGELARADWNRRRPWGYGSQQLYPLTRGMEDAGIPPLARWPLYPFTAIFDTGNLVFGAIGGLWGD